MNREMLRTVIQVILVCLSILFRNCLCQGYEVLSVQAGQFFQYALEKEIFFDRFLLDAAESIVFHPSLLNNPGLPSWLRFLQSTPNHPGYLYGTPRNQDLRIYELQIIGQKLNTYQSSRVLLTINVTNPGQEYSKYLAFFLIANQNIEDFLKLSNSTREEFVQNTTVLWVQGSSVSLYSLTSGVDLDLRVPLPPDQSQGVGVTVSSSQPPKMDLNATFQMKCQNVMFSTSVDLDTLFHPDFNVSWCDSNLIVIGKPAIPPGPLYLGGGYDAPSLEVYSMDFLHFVIIVIVPNSILIIVLLIMIYVMFFRREGRVKREERTPNIQLAHHQMIRQASLDLRSLSNRRDGGPTPVVSPMSSRAGSRDHLRTPSEGSRTPLPARMTPPPPYRLPPTPRTPRTPRMQETSFNLEKDNSRRLSEPMQRKALKLSHAATSTPDLII